MTHARYPTRGETVEYLRNYAQHFSIPVRTGAAVHRVMRDAAPGWAVELATGDVLTAPAPSSRPPAAIATPTGHGSTGTPEAVVVVGAGNSAVRVAQELAQVTKVTLATRSPVSLRHSRHLGIDLHYWVAWSGIDRLPLGRRAGTSIGVLDDGTYARPSLPGDLKTGARVDPQETVNFNGFFLDQERRWRRSDQPNRLSSALMDSPPCRYAASPPTGRPGRLR